MFKKIIIAISSIIIVLIIFGLIEVISAIKELPDINNLLSFQPTQSTKIYDRTGKVLLYEIHGNQNRTIIPDKDIPIYAKQATIAIEDKDFYNHSAFDIKAIIRAAIENIKKGSIVQGGSTITQQLVKNTFLTPKKTIKRKLKEIILAYWLEKHYTKNKILWLYLNQISYGSNAYGIESASQLFFGKHAKDLTIEESAYLASLIKAPSYYSPWGSHKDELDARKNYVLEQMYKMGFIDKEQLTTAENKKVSFMKPTLGNIKAPHFVMMVKQYLENKYGKYTVENGGLKVITTLNWDMQEKAEEAVKSGAERNKKLYQGENASMVVQDPKTGQILALVGSADYFNNDIDGQFNVAVQGLRQPGSTFKPFAYLAAFEKGFTPDTIVFDTPTEFTPNNPLCPINVIYTNSNKKCFHPQNFDDVFRGPVSFKQALAQSINVPSVKVLYLAGIQNTIDIAHRLGITTLNNPSNYGLSLVLGGGEVKLIDLVNAYSVLAQNGIKHKQSFILKVEDSKGNILEQNRDIPQRVIDKQNVEEINKILSDIKLRSGLFHKSLNLTVFDGYDVALKTGTTNDYRDAWTIGYTPFLTVGVWAGNSNYKPMIKHGSSILAAVPIWSEFMNSVIYSYKPEMFENPNPISSDMPMLNGQYIIYNPETQSTQIHSILYYIDKNNLNKKTNIPNPGNDPQFKNWEIPVLNWVKNNITNINNLNINNNGENNSTTTEKNN